MEEEVWVQCTSQGSRMGEWVAAPVIVPFTCLLFNCQKGNSNCLPKEILLLSPSLNFFPFSGKTNLELAWVRWWKNSWRKKNKGPTRAQPDQCPHQNTKVSQPWQLTRLNSIRSKNFHGLGPWLWRRCLRAEPHRSLLSSPIKKWCEGLGTPTHRHKSCRKTPAELGSTCLEDANKWREILSTKQKERGPQQLWNGGWHVQFHLKSRVWKRGRHNMQSCVAFINSFVGSSYFILYVCHKQLDHLAQSILAHQPHTLWFFCHQLRLASAHHCLVHYFFRSSLAWPIWTWLCFGKNMNRIKTW